MTDATETEAPSEGWMLSKQWVKGYCLRAFRLPYFEDTILEFIQVDHPDGTSSYFRSDGQGGVEAGPFGGGYSWTVPKYVVKAAARFFNEIFPPVAETQAEEPAA